jgi:hypothetical protein
MRSFHATKADGRESLCDSLGFTKKEVDVCYFYIYIFILLVVFHFG